MRISRIHYSGSLHPNADVELDGCTHHYISHVLRLAPGNALRFFNGAGKEYLCRITHIDKRAVRLVCEQEIETLPESLLQLDLFLSISKGASMDFAVQKATELGVTAIHPVITEYTLRRSASGDGSGRTAHWEGVVRSAAEQCGRAVLPNLYAPLTLAELRPPPEAALLALVPGAGLALSERLRQLADQGAGQGDCAAVGLLIGPEGGLSERDLTALTRLGFEPVNIGMRVLRTETAVAAATSLAQALLGDLR